MNCEPKLGYPTCSSQALEQGQLISRFISISKINLKMKLQFWILFLIFVAVKKSETREGEFRDIYTTVQPTSGSSTVYPFMVAIVQVEKGVPKLLQEATLIDATHILTRGDVNYISDYISGGLTIEAWIGVSNLDNFSGPKIPILFENIHVDPGRGANIFTSAAIIELTTAVMIPSEASPICIGTSIYDQKQLKFIGFGAFGCNPTYRRTLRVATGKIVPNGDCDQRIHTIRGVQLTIQSPLICADLQTVNNNVKTVPQYGDYGAPLFLMTGETFVQVGLFTAFVERDNGCPILEVPSVYISLKEIQPFIEQFAPAATFCDDNN